ncbi:MAG: helix-turn-helix domain-containing protein [Ekhidna sp.]
MIELQETAELAARYINSTNRHIFLTGKAGTGKTTFLKYIIDHTYKNTVVAAPTGIAAINAGGVTLHSLLQLPFGTFIPENSYFPSSNIQFNTPQTLFRESRFNANKRKLIQELELLIIDEVSMLRADLLDCIDHTLRYLRKRKFEPFGGLQILFIGDLMQLPPVVKEEEAHALKPFYKSNYFFEARALQEQPPIRVELKKIYRQSDQDFIDLLNRLRNNEQNQDDLNWLNRYYNPDFDQANETGYIHLTTHNYRADKLNQSKLQNLESPLHTFYAHIEGEFPENAYPTTEELHLKAGAQVMFIKNDPSGEGQFFNGKIGTISTLSDEEIWVQFENGDEVLVSPYKWENKRYTLDKVTNEIEEKLLGSFEQFPIKLAWAVTVHKSQGLTFEKAILDMSGTFAPGQLYVALSRLTSLKGLVFSSPLPENPPSIDASLKSFVSSFDSDEALTQHLKEDRKKFIEEFSRQAFDFSGLIRELEYHERGFNKDENRSLKQQFLPWTQDFTKEVSELRPHGNGFINQVLQILTGEDYLSFLAERMEKAGDYFIPRLQELQSRLSHHRKQLKRESKVKTYKKELENLEEVFTRQIRQITKLVLLIQKANEDKVLSKQDLRDAPSYQAEPKIKEKKDKTPTAEITYKLFKEGKSISEIAKERGYVVGTIEGHLAQYVENGTIPITELVKEKRVEKIMKVLTSDAVGLGEIKSRLPKDYTYGEIKLVVAHMKAVS